MAKKILLSIVLFITVQQSAPAQLVPSHSIVQMTLCNDHDCLKGMLDLFSFELFEMKDVEYKYLQSSSGDLIAVYFNKAFTTVVYATQSLETHRKILIEFKDLHGFEWKDYSTTQGKTTSVYMSDRPAYSKSGIRAVEEDVDGKKVYKVVFSAYK